MVAQISFDSLTNISIDSVYGALYKWDGPWAKYLKNVLCFVHLIVLIGVPGKELRWAVRQKFVFLDDNIALRASRAEITEFDVTEVGLENQNVIQFDVQVAHIFVMYPV